MLSDHMREYLTISLDLLMVGQSLSKIITQIYLLPIDEVLGENICVLKDDNVMHCNLQ